MTDDQIDAMSCEAIEKWMGDHITPDGYMSLVVDNLRLEPGYEPVQTRGRGISNTLLRYVVDVTIGSYKTTYSWAEEAIIYFADNPFTDPHKKIRVPLKDHTDGWFVRPYIPGVIKPAPECALIAILNDAKLGSYVSYEDACLEGAFRTDSRKDYDAWLECRDAFAAMYQMFGAELPLAIKIASRF